MPRPAARAQEADAVLPCRIRLRIFPDDVYRRHADGDAGGVFVHVGTNRHTICRTGLTPR